ncbi:porin family protein [Porphyromonas pogonae]|uniref:porin family protein n=1 Tax=Porphyromonas pogonae TaxID=867595 RepID=UPI002E7A9C82|nr:porin family protein [Porphyromonas pogonae]
MKKIFSLILIAGLSICGVHAQESNPIGLRVQAGLTLSMIKGFGDGTMHPGYTVGVSYDIPVNQYFSVRPGLRFINKGENTKYGDTKIKVSPSYLEMPIYATFTFETGCESNVYLGAGPYFAYGITGKAKASSGNIASGVTEIDLFSKHNNGDQKPFKNFDAGLSGVVGFEYSRFFIEGALQLGLAQVHNKDFSIAGSPLFTKNDTKSWMASALITAGFKF